MGVFLPSYTQPVALEKSKHTVSRKLLFIKQTSPLAKELNWIWEDLLTKLPKIVFSYNFAETVYFFFHWR